MIRSHGEFYQALRNSAEIMHYHIPNSSVLLDVYVYIDNFLVKELNSEERVVKNTQQLNVALRYAITFIIEKYGALPAKLQPAKKLFCLLASDKVHTHFGTLIEKDTIGVIVPFKWIGSDLLFNIRHEFLHSCAKVHHGEVALENQLFVHVNEMRDELLLQKSEARKLLSDLHWLNLSKHSHELLDNDLRMLVGYDLARFDNTIKDMGIAMIISMLNIKEDIEILFSISKSNLANVYTTVVELESKKNMIPKDQLYKLEYILLIENIPFGIIPLIYNHTYSQRAKSLLGNYFNEITRLTDPIVYERVLNVYNGYLELLKPHKIDLINSNFNINKLIHTEENIAASKSLHKLILAGLTFPKTNTIRQIQ